MIRTLVGAATAALPPGADRFNDASSRTRTQSFWSGGTNDACPVVGYSPTSVASPVRGLNHQARAAIPASCRRSIVTVLDVGIYAITVEPSVARPAAASVSPAWKPEVSTLWF